MTFPHSSRCALLAAVLAAASTEVRAVAVEYPDFSAPTGLNLGGSAAIVTSADGRVLRLTPAQGLTAGSAFSTTGVSVAGFSAFFQFRITQTSYLPADGLVFVIQSTPSGVGGTGGMEGYGGLSPSVGVEFDTIQNTWDPNDNHIGILLNGDVTQYLGTGAFSPNTRLADGDLWSVWIDYDGTTLEVRAADGSNVRPSGAVTLATIDIGQILGQTNAYLGFSAGTGSFWENHDIVTWQFNDGCAVSIGSATASFGAAGGSGSIPVTAAPGCSWPVLTTAPWIHLTTPAVAAGNGAAGYSVDANTGGARSAVVEVSGQSFVVNQASAPVTNLPQINAGGVTDPWTYIPGVSPGGWISIFGSNLANAAQSWSPAAGQPLPTSLGGVTVTVDGIAAPLAYVSPGLVNALTPSAAPQGQVPIVLTNQGLTASTYAAQSTPILAAIYCNPVPGASPVRYSVTAVDPVSGELLGSSAVDPRVARAVHPGDTIDLYAVGLGPTTPQFPTATDFTAADPVASNFVVLLGVEAITPSFAALVAPGLYQIRITVPAGMPVGDQPIVLDFSVGRSASNVVLTIQ